MATVAWANKPGIALDTAGVISATLKAFLHLTTAAVVLGNIADVFLLALWVFVVDKSLCLARSH